MAIYGKFTVFSEADLRNVVRKFFSRDFEDVAWIKNIFRLIRVIIRTNSHVIWTCIWQDIHHFAKRAANTPLKTEIPACKLHKILRYRDAQR